MVGRGDRSERGFGGEERDIAIEIVLRGLASNNEFERRLCRAIRRLSLHSVQIHSLERALGVRAEKQHWPMFSRALDEILSVIATNKRLPKPNEMPLTPVPFAEERDFISYVNAMERKASKRLAVLRGMRTRRASQLLRRGRRRR